jgi:hypothetical protein
MRKTLPVNRSFWLVFSLLAAAGCGGNVMLEGNNANQVDPALSGKSGVQHPACGQPTPDPMPPITGVQFDPTGRPTFDLWRDLSCSGSPASVTSCNGSGQCDNGSCLVSGDDGVCTYSDVDIWCDGEGSVMGFAYGACWMCSPDPVHAAACCAEVEGFDCRAWPYPGNSAPGMVCARHEDCEAGLVCGATAGDGYGICQCPGTDPVSLVPPLDCLQQ